MNKQECKFIYIRHWKLYQSIQPRYAEKAILDLLENLAKEDT